MVGFDWQFTYKVCALDMNCLILVNNIQETIVGIPALISTRGACNAHEELGPGIAYSMLLPLSVNLLASCACSEVTVEVEA